MKDIIYISNRMKKKAVEQHGLSIFKRKYLEPVINYHRSLEGYDETPLYDLHHLADYLGVGKITLKDESERFGLNAFKVLGASYAIQRHMDALAADPHASARPEVGKHENLTFVSATDGNHGRGVAWAAQKLGARAVIYMPHGSTEYRADAIRSHGADCIITDLNYDDAVRYARREAEANGWFLVQDTALSGYTHIPEWIMQGYTTLAQEIIQRLNDKKCPPLTHVILQAGVGSFAGAVCGYLSELYGVNAPRFLIVEPHSANCLYTSVKADDGSPHNVGGTLETIMAGLACGEPNSFSWPVLRDYADDFFSVSDSLAEKGMRILSSPLATDPRVISGESGAAGAGLLNELMINPAWRDIQKAVGLGPDSHVLIISTEGDTSPDVYEQIVWKGSLETAGSRHA